MPKKLKTKQYVKSINGNSFVFTTEPDESTNKYIETKVTLNGNLFCWIKFTDIDSFVNEFGVFLNKFKLK
jgi:hypothetical protein